MSAPRALEAVTLVVRDYDEAIAYFTNVLGFARLEDTPLGGGKRWVRVGPPGGGTTLLLARAATPAQEARVGAQTGGRVAFFLSTDDFGRDHRALCARGVRFSEEPRTEAYGRVAVFEDLYGNRWDLVERPPAAGSVSALSAGELERLWAEHLAGEFEQKDVEATLATMVEDASVNHVPVGTGGRGKAALRAFYRDDFIPSWPGDLELEPVNRVVGAGQLVDELHLRFTHERLMPWFLPGVPPTGRRVELDLVVVVEFRGDKLAAERIYWDHARVLRQVGLRRE
jgi:catechol 2,3-dioxygenase-like lactoylglutathione lyase family enzyme